ncbi:MAG: hypothetical protein QY320_06460 [Gammaproteobacteria bacterium]|nr:MAG: hypothetical protein QY320_06460 [Gammaproteobacteria bacterium]
MNSNHENAPQGVSMSMRIIAGLLAIGVAIAAFDVLRHSTMHDEIGVSVFLVVACVVCISLFSYVSIRGRQPRWLNQLTNTVDRKLADDAAIGSRSWVSDVSVIVTFSGTVGILFFLLASNYVFERSVDRGWFVYGVFLLAWFVVAASFFWYSRYSFKRRRDNPESNSDGKA